MGALECAGCTLIAFGPPTALFLLVVVRDPLRIILFVAGAFFWLLSLLLSAVVWYAVVPLRQTPIFSLFFSVAFQEVFRFLYFLILKNAEKGLQRVAETGMHIDGVHSLKNAKHTVAMVCGMGFGVMSGAFSLVNLLADANGPGTVGLVQKLIPEETGVHFYGDYKLFLTSAIGCAAFILLHVMWNVVFWHSCYTKKWIPVIVVVLSHFVVSGLSILNVYGLQAVSLSVTYVILLLMSIWAFATAGGSWENVRKSIRSLFGSPSEGAERLALPVDSSDPVDQRGPDGAELSDAAADEAAQI